MWPQLLLLRKTKKRMANCYLVNGSNLVKYWKYTIDEHTRCLTSPRKQFLWIKETFLWYTAKEKISLNSGKFY